MDLLKSENFVESNFQIETNALSFQILSADLYSDRIGSLTREQTTNCADDHRLIRQARPFDVHLPNNFEDVISVRDYGPGLSQEEIIDIYAVYFKSSKRDSNAQ